MAGWARIRPIGPRSMLMTYSCTIIEQRGESSVQTASQILIMLKSYRHNYAAYFISPTDVLVLF